MIWPCFERVRGADALEAEIPFYFAKHFLAAVGSDEIAAAGIFYYESVHVGGMSEENFEPFARNAELLSLLGVGTRIVYAVAHFV